ncbi:MAG: hypothetical protein AAB739_00030 [Patescibacteria group bacterium]
MKKLLCKISAVIIMIVLLPVQSAFAGTFTYLGTPVQHDHPGYCGPNGCPIKDSTFESKWGFKSTDKIYSGTHQWNCHGRTFDNKQSWISSINPYFNPSAYIMATPGYGTAVVFFKNGQAIHSATTVGAWNGMGTMIMSKYGKQGQYKHTLSNSIAVYGWNFSPLNFTGPVKIYTASNGTRNIDGVSIKNNFTASRIESLLREREKMPWYKDILEAKKIYETEHPKLVARSANMNQARLDMLNNTADTSKKIALLIEDLKDESHYVALSAYDHPSYATEFIEGIEAGKQLVSLAGENPTLKSDVVKQLRDILATKSKENHKDALDGATSHFLGQILTQTEKDALRTELGTTTQIPGFQTYRDFYLNRM